MATQDTTWTHGRSRTCSGQCRSTTTTTASRPVYVILLFSPSSEPADIIHSTTTTRIRALVGTHPLLRSSHLPPRRTRPITSSATPPLSGLCSLLSSRTARPKTRQARSPCLLATPPCRQCIQSKRCSTTERRHSPSRWTGTTTRLRSRRTSLRITTRRHRPWPTRRCPPRSTRRSCSA
jgi:hypothetical protein